MHICILKIYQFKVKNIKFLFSLRWCRNFQTLILHSIDNTGKQYSSKWFSPSNLLSGMNAILFVHKV